MAVSFGFDGFDPRRMTQPVSRLSLGFFLLLFLLLGSSWFPRIFNPVFEQGMTALPGRKVC
jgi:hypothetical protein